MLLLLLLLDRRSRLSSSFPKSDGEFWVSFVGLRLERKVRHFIPKCCIRREELIALLRELLWCYWAVQSSWFARVNALCNLSRKKSREVAASLPGRFLSRRCFTLCITTEAEPRIAKQYKCHHCCSCKNYRGKGVEGGEKSVFVSFFD